MITGALRDIGSRTALVADLGAEISRCYPAWGVTGLRPVGEGLENLVCRAESEAFGPIALRAPWTRVIDNANDQGFDARDLLRQEADMARHMGQHGVPVPAVCALHLDGHVDFLVSEFVVSDGSRPTAQAMGRVTAAIHAAPPLRVAPVAMGGGSLASVLAERISRRIAVAAQLGGMTLPPLPAAGELDAALTWDGARRGVLHMDIRPANFLSRDGELLAVVDWGNALLGDPALELARIAESGECGPLAAGFLEGYGVAEPFAHVPRAVELVYRLDTAVMLALVFLSEAPEQARARHYLDRTAVLCGQLARAL